MKKEIFNEKFFLKLEDNVKKFHELFSFNHLKSEMLEEIISKSMNHIEHEWECYSHNSKYDIKISDFTIQVKSGKIDKKGEKLTISSFRSTKYNTIEKKINFFEENSSDIILSMVFNDVKKEYSIFLIDKKTISYRKEWIKTKGGYSYKDGKVDMKIAHSMSDQLWLDIYIKKLDINPVWKIKI